MLHLRGAFDPKASGLWGETAEYAPYIALWASFGADREIKTIAIPENGDSFALPSYTLPPVSKLSGDEAIEMRLFVKTRQSHIAEIDKEESNYVERERPAGSTAISLHQLLQTPQASLDLFDQALYTFSAHLEPYLKNKDDRLALATKGRLDVKATFAGLSAPDRRTMFQSLDAMMVKGRNASGDLVYNSPLFHDKLQRMCHVMQESYQEHLRTYKQVNEAGAMQVMGLYSDFGVEPIIAMGMHDWHSRELTQHVLKHEKPQYEKLYDVDEKSARLFEQMMRSSAQRHGFGDSARLVAILATQHSRTDDGFEKEYLTAIQALLDAGTMPGNALHYTSDYSMPHKGLTMKLFPKGLPREKEDKKAGRKHWTGVKMMNSMYRIRGAAAATAGKDEKDEEPIPPSPYDKFHLEHENMDALELYGAGNANDCENMAHHATAHLRTQEMLSLRSSILADCPILTAARGFYQYMLICDSIGAVTARFLDPNGKKTKKKLTELPLIGSADDKKEWGGHGWGFGLNVFIAYERLKIGGCNVEKELPELHRLVQSMPEWAKKLPIPTIEGTSSADELVIPVAEVAAHMYGDSSPECVAYYKNAVQAKKKFLTYLREQHAEFVGQINARPDGLPFYVDPIEPNRRSSTFYLGVSHFTSQRLYRMNPRYGQLLFVDTVAKTRCLEYGQFCRLAFGVTKDNAGVGIIPVFGSISVDQWKREVAPVMACIQNQKPMSMIGRIGRPGQPSFELSLARQAHPISSATLRQLGGMGSSASLRAEILDRHALGMQRIGATIEGTDANTTREENTATTTTSYCLFTLAKRTLDGANAAMIEKKLKGMVNEGVITEYSFIGDRPVPASDEMISIVVKIPSHHPPKE